MEKLRISTPPAPNQNVTIKVKNLGYLNVSLPLLNVIMPY